MRGILGMEVYTITCLKVGFWIRRCPTWYLSSFLLIHLVLPSFLLLWAVQAKGEDIIQGMKNDYENHHTHHFNIARLPILCWLLCSLLTTQLPDILPPNGGRYELQALHSDYGSIVPYYTAKEHLSENTTRACANRLN